MRSSETNKDFVSRNFAYFDCSRHTTCSSCVKAQWACNWCVHENRCTHNASTCQRTVVSGENVSLNLKQPDNQFVLKIIIIEIILIESGPLEHARGWFLPAPPPPVGRTRRAGAEWCRTRTRPRGREPAAPASWPRRLPMPGRH